jgi:hypothetical protein
MLFQRMAALIPLFKVKQLKPAWKFDADTLIWRIVFTSKDRLVGETRNQETKSTSFFCLDLYSGKPLWKDMRFEEPWWIGIEAVHERWLFLHGFVRPDIPEHRGIRVLDIETGKLLWRNDALSFWFIDKDKLYAHQHSFDKHIACELDMNTGTTLKEYSGDLESLLKLRQQVLDRESDHEPHVSFPELFDEHESAPNTGTVVRLITEGKALEGWIEYLVHREMLIVSHYRRYHDHPESPLLNNILTLYDLKLGKTLYNEIIAKEVKAPSPDAFFVKDDLLIFIQHQTMITALQLWKS